jgi:hypothetical protein
VHSRTDLDHSKDAHDHVGMWTFQDQLSGECGFDVVIILVMGQERPKVLDTGLWRWIINIANEAHG